jgi:quinone-modifying oxidoreductase subunit QmoC
VAVYTSVLGVKRFWATLRNSVKDERKYTEGKTLKESIKAALLNVFTHRDFNSCGTAHLRMYSHLAVFYGFIALGVVSFWVVTARFNPLIRGEFLYPLGFLDPMKILANVAGVAVLAGCALMIKERLLGERPGGRGAYFDWSLIATIILVVVTGFLSEALHYTRLEPHRQIAYFVHLSLVLALILYLPYSKMAHMIYRTTALVFAEYTGRMAEREEKTNG